MDTTSKEFVTELFLDDSVSVNRLVVAAANLINEHNENIYKFNQSLKGEMMSVSYLNGEKTSTRVQDFYETHLMNLTEEDYINRFKMKKATVQALINTLKEAKPDKYLGHLDKKVHVFLWLLTSDSTYDEVGKLFGLHKSSVSYIYHEIASLIAELRFQYISWPSLEEQHVTRVKVNTCYKFPNCVGFINACRLKVGSQINKKNKPNIVLLQAVCDESLIFLDIHVGDIGVTHKNRVFRKSNLSSELKNFVEFENHILGDSQYKLKKNLITPFTTEELLTDEEMKFNEVHWNAQSYIGRAFELLKEKFKKLNYIKMSSRQTMETLIFAACVLHNFILLQEGFPEIKEEMILCDNGLTIDTNVVKTATEKRQFLCNYINYIDRQVC